MNLIEITLKTIYPMVEWSLFCKSHDTQMQVHGAKYYSTGLIHANFQPSSFKTEITPNRSILLSEFA